MFSKQTAFVLAAALFASPVAAADTAQVREPAAKPTKAKKYCVAEAMTGTRMSTKVCKTKADWDKAGVDIDADASKK